MMGMRPMTSSSGPRLLRTVRLLVLAALLAGSSGCKPGSAAVGASPTEARPSFPVIVSNWGGYRIRIERADPIPVNRLFDLRVSVEVAGPHPERRPHPGLGVTVDAEMPAHHHGMIRIPQVTRLGDDAFLARGLLFHMSGHWQLYIDITEGGRTDRAEVGLDLP